MMKRLKVRNEFSAFYLRKNLNYNGVIISDDMIMKGVEKYGHLESVIMGIKAGVDMFIFREADDKTLKIIEDLALAVEKDDELKTKIILKHYH
mgnify:CR=1 FL=1